MKRAVCLAAVVLVALVAFFLVLDLNSETINRVLLHLPGIDKPAHFIEFGLVFFIAHLLAGRFVRSDRKRLLAAVAFALALSLFDELQQRWFSGRSFEIADLLANLAGILFAVSLIYVRPRDRRWAWAAAAVALAGVAALTVHSYNAERHYKRGLLYELQGQHSLAREQYLLAIENGTSSPGLHNSLAWALLETDPRDVEAALDHAAQAFSMQPDNPDILDTYGWALVQAGRPAEALPHLQRVLDLDSGMFCIHYHLGMAYLGLGARDLAREHLTRQIEVAPRASETERARRILESSAATGPAERPTDEAGGVR